MSDSWTRVVGDPSRPIDRELWRADHDGGDEDDPGRTMATVLMVGATFDWWVNHPDSPRNIKPVMLIGHAL